jgi:hypothetical protein
MRGLVHLSADLATDEDICSAAEATD